MKRALKTPPLRILDDMFCYDPVTGVFTRRCDGSSVGGKSDGYIVLWIGGRRHKAHRIAWALYYRKEVPVDIEIDHINGDRADNRLSNLRLATAMQNMWNHKPSKSNSSGFKGINFDRQTGKWRSRIEVNGRSISLGRHETKEGAVKARREAERKYYGEFSPNC